MAKWEPGESGNPVGRKSNAERKALLESVRSLFGPWAERAKNQIVEIMETAPEPRDRLAAAKVVLERLYGKPKEHVTINEVSEEISNWSDDRLFLEASKILEKYRGDTGSMH